MKSQKGKLKTKHKVAIGLFLLFLLVVCGLNRKYEVIAFHPFGKEGQTELNVMTWNVHCSLWADSIRQQAIAELILREDVDLVLLNEYNQDSCRIADSLLRERYPFTVERNSHQKSGDIFYSTRMMSNTGRVYRRRDVKGVQITKTTIAAGRDSVQVFGVHLASNHFDTSATELGNETDLSFFQRYKAAQENRCFQAHWIKEAVVRSSIPVVLMGDMNDFSCSAPLDTITSCGLVDAWWEGGNGYGSTFHSGWMRLRIDHIFHSEELKLVSIKVIDTNLSDHHPVVAGFRVEK